MSESQLVRVNQSAGPLGVVPEIVIVTGEAGDDRITHVVNLFIVEGVIPAEQELSSILELFWGEGGRGGGGQLQLREKNIVKNENL